MTTHPTAAKLSAYEGAHRRERLATQLLPS